MREPYTQLFLHLVWSTWDRLPIIPADAEPRLYACMRAKLRELKCVTIATGGMEDHAHVLCRFHPAHSISYIVQQIKGGSSHFMNHELRRGDWFKWQGSYGAFTVSKDEVGRIRDYILNQKQHHTRGDIWQEWEHTWIPDDYVEEFVEQQLGE